MPDNTTGTQDNTQPNPQGTTQTPGETPATWKIILQGLPEEAQMLYSQHTQGLKSALESERQARKDLAGQLRDASSQLEAGSQARTDLEKLQGQFEEQIRRADFAEQSMTQGVTNTRLAYLAAQEFDTFDQRGNVNWTALQEAAPELFRQSPPARGNAGNGTRTPPQPAQDMNAMIRRAAGRQ